ncbi:MAG: hypothetical protein M1818_005612 [Claussenomyces sp. TS43310]|nr:MAG: hypothetical protein M1818_005612 [Claussenomyces sp. TS43310]
MSELRLTTSDLPVPNKLAAAKGDMVQFQFFPENRSVTRNIFDARCEPLADRPNVMRVFLGLMPVKATNTAIPSYAIVIDATTSMWLYCSQAMHCQRGMLVVINEE